MARKSKKKSGAGTLIPRARKSARATAARARRRETVLPSTPVHFNQRGELVIGDPALQRELLRRIAAAEVVIRFGPTPVPMPPPYPNSQCDCRGVRFGLLERIREGRPTPGRPI